MNSRERLLAAIEGNVPDRLPVTTHHLMQYFLNEYMGGISNEEFFDFYGLDPIFWTNPVQHHEIDNNVYAEQWHVESEEIPGEQFYTVKHTIHTPQGILSLRSLFNGGMETEDGKSHSWDAVKAKLQEIVDNEDKSKPLSDDEIKERLSQEGIGNIARRTVAKYRKLLNIPTARFRKKY